MNKVLINQGRLIYRMDSAIKGTLTMQVPDGWKVEPLQTLFHLAAQEKKIMQRLQALNFIG